MLECVHLLPARGVCFKSSPSEMAEKYEEENSGTQQDNHSEYLRIIDDLSTELNTLSRQVNMVQNEFPTEEVAKQFESSLKGLETQNDLLQAAVESLIEEREAIERRLQTQNEDFKCRICKQEEQICALRRQLAQCRDAPCGRCGARKQAECSQRDDRRAPAPSDSTEELRKLEYELRRKSKTVDSLKSQNAKLNEELCEIRRSQARFKLLQRRGHPSYTEVKQNDVVEPMPPADDCMAKLNAANERNQEQSKSLQRASKDIASLHQEIEDLRAKEETFSKEVQSSIQESQISINKEPILENTQRDLLQTELIALKERQASQMGTQQSLQEQLQGTINELYVAKEKLHESMQLKERLESVHREEMKRFQDLKADMFQKYNNLVEDYNNVLKEYQKVVQIEQEKTNQLRAFNAWKDEQIQSEREICRKMQMYEDHIKNLLEDKQRLLDKLNETENDNRTLLQTIERTRMNQSSNQYGRVNSPSRGYNVVAASSSTDPVSKVIENVRCTSRRLSQQRCMLQEEYYSTIN